jgi:nucleotide-binding universal stress UspA family protein
MDNVRDILVGINLGESSKRAFAEAKELADRLGARLHLLCVAQDPSALPWAPSASDDTLLRLLEQMQRDAKAHLVQLVSPKDRERLRAELVVRVGRRPSSEILAYAADKHVDVIVVGKGDNGSPEAAAETGSAAEAVVRGATCPVLVVPARSTTHRSEQK